MSTLFFSISQFETAIAQNYKIHLSSVITETLSGSLSIR